MADWSSVAKRKANRPTNAQVVNTARRHGANVLTEEKYGAATNKQHQTTKNTAKLDRETEELKHDKISIDVGHLIQQGRQAKGFTQKELATKINEKPQIIQEYESGKAIPNNIIMGKLERSLGIKLRGKDKGQPLQPPGKNKK